HPRAHVAVEPLLLVEQGGLGPLLAGQSPAELGHPASVSNVCSSQLPPDGAGQLGLVHSRPALDAPLSGLVVELVVGAAARPSMGPQPAPPARGDVLHRGAALPPGPPATAPPP